MTKDLKRKVDLTSNKFFNKTELMTEEESMKVSKQTTITMEVHLIIEKKSTNRIDMTLTKIRACLRLK
jgi:DUF4097 and DUF4098 domain-containing protein YvlB